MTKNVEDAILLLHQRNERLVKKGANVRELEANDLALDELVRCQDRVGNPKMLCKFALKSAYKKLGWREKYHARNTEEDFTDYLAQSADTCCTNELEYKIIEIEDFIKRSSTNARTKELFGYLQKDMSVDEIAIKMGVTKERAAVWVSRARKQLKLAWEVAI